MDNLHELRLLIVEDEALIAEEIKDRLEAMGARIVGMADTAEAAIEIAGRERPAIVLMDIRLKGETDGIDAAVEIYNRFGIPTVFLTAYSDRSTLDRVISVGQFGYLTKPFREKDLATTISLAIHRHRIEAGLRESQLSLEGVVDRAAQALIAIDRNLRVRYMNTMAETLTRISAPEALAKEVDAVLRLKDESTGKPETELVNRVILQDQGPIENETFLLVNQEGSETPIELSVTRVIDHERTVGATVSFNSLIERRREEEEKRRKEQELQDQRNLLGTLIDGIPEMFFAVDANRELVVVNNAFLETFGLKRPDVIGKRIGENWSDGGLRDVDRQTDLAIRTGNRITFQQRAWLDHDDNLRWFVFTYMPLARGGNIALIGTATDITERQQVEEEFLEATNRENQRVGRDLHDGLGQELTSVSLLTTSLENEVGKLAPQLLPQIGEIKDAVARSMTATRAAAQGLAPTDLTAEGLVTALQLLASRSARSYGIACNYVGDVDRIPDIDPGSATHIYRIAQEASANAARHARAERITIELKIEDGQLILIVSDDGVGLSAKQAQRRSGMGLRIMDYRAQKIGGSISIEEPSVGTRVVMTVPLSILEASKDHRSEARAYG